MVEKRRGCDVISISGARCCFDVSRRRRSLKERLRHKGVFRHERRLPVSAGRGVEFSCATLAKGKISPEYSASENVHYSFDVAENGGRGGRRGRQRGEKFSTLESIVGRGND